MREQKNATSDELVAKVESNGQLFPGPNFSMLNEGSQPEKRDWAAIVNESRVTLDEPSDSPDGQGITAGQEEADKEQFTDLGNARRFARLHGQNFRYTQQWGWLTWSGERWTKDKTGLAMREAKRTATGYYIEAARLHDQA